MAKATTQTQKVEPVVEPVVEEPIRGIPKAKIEPSKAQLDELAKMTSKSQKIRYLAAHGFSTQENLYSGIAHFLGIKTQFVRNVLTKPLKKADTTS